LEITVGSSFAIGCGSCAPAYINRNAYQLADDVDLVRGPHQLSFGVDAIRAQVNSFTPSDANGNYTFNGQFTGDAVADFLLGDLSNFDQSAARTQAFRQTILGFYVQDVYRLSSKITINAGLRWEPYFAPYTLGHVGSVFDFSAFYAGKTSSVFTNAPPGSF
jgi:outer membrane receptor protein involved in Fe transport